MQYKTNKDINLCIEMEEQRWQKCQDTLIHNYSNNQTPL